MSVVAKVSTQAELIPLCKPGHTAALVSTAAAWLKAAPAEPLAATWLSQALYIRGLEADGLRSPCAPAPVFVDSGPPSDPAARVLYHADQSAGMGWNHIIRSAAARSDAEVSLCLAESALKAGFEPIVFRRRVRILMDLGRDDDLRRAVREIAATPERMKPEGLVAWFVPYVEDYLGAGREVEAGELTLLLRELDPKAAARLEPVRRAVVLQARSKHKSGTAERQRADAWIAERRFDKPWAPPPRRRARQIVK
jgi:hypothetical protein